MTDERRNWHKSENDMKIDNSTNKSKMTLKFISKTFFTGEKMLLLVIVNFIVLLQSRGMNGNDYCRVRRARAR